MSAGGSDPGPTNEPELLEFPSSQCVSNSHTRTGSCWPRAVASCYSATTVSPLATLLPLVLLVACQAPEVAPANGAAPRSEPPAIELTRAEFLDSTGDNIRAHGFARHVFFRRDTGEAWATEVRVLVPRPQSRSGTLVLESPQAQGNPLESRLHAQGGVTFGNEAGDRGDTERLSYFGKEGRAVGDRPLRLLGPNYTLTANGFRWSAEGDTLDLGPATLVSRSDP
jgi:hypothetical protein